MDRPQLRKLRDLVNTRAIAGAIVYDPDRLSYNLGHQLLLPEDIERAGMKLLIVSHPMQQGPERYRFFQMRGAVVLAFECDLPLLLVYGHFEMA